MKREYNIISEAFDGRSGKQIRLPANGRVALRAGDVVRVRNEFLTLSGPASVVKVTVTEDYETMHYDRLEKEAI